MYNIYILIYPPQLLETRAHAMELVDSPPPEDPRHPFKGHPTPPTTLLQPPPRLHSHIKAPRGVLARLRAVPWRDLLPPSSIAAILASIAGCVPLLKDLLVSEAAPLGTVYHSLDMMAGASVPCMMLGLGATLVGNRGNALPATVVVAVTVVRLIVLPMLGTC